MIDINNIRQYGRQWANKNLTPAKKPANGEASFVCPFCGHGEHGDGLCFDPKSKDGNSLKCFSCGFYGDLLDLYTKLNNIDKRAAIEQLAAELNIQDLNESPAPANPVKTLDQDSQEKLFKDYLAKRGVSDEQIQKHKLSFNSDSKGVFVVIPTSEGGNVKRYINLEGAGRVVNSAGKAGLFNAKILDTLEPKKPVFVCEGAFDAMAIENAGGLAIGLNSTNNTNSLIKALGEKQDKGEIIKTTFIACLDNDKAGNNATDQLLKDLRGLSIYAIDGRQDLYKDTGCKDPNELLTKNKPALLAGVKQALEKATNTKPYNVSTYIDNRFLADLEKSATFYPTGFKNLDDKIKGLRGGMVYALAAGTSMGKTTFAHQLADNLAGNNHDVIYFSLEQTEKELVSKSITRQNALDHIAELDSKKFNSFTACNILDFDISDNQQKDFESATNNYKKRVGDRLQIINGLCSANISFIKNYTKHFIGMNDSKPVIIVDYLQLLEPEPAGNFNRNTTTKETVDIAMKQLKQIAVNYDVPVLVICSINRANYNSTFNFEALKESGIIEFTADFVCGLEFTAIANMAGDSEKKSEERRQKINEEKAKQPRELTFKVLKNRRGEGVFSINFNYYSRYETFRPVIIQARKTH